MTHEPTETSRYARSIEMHQRACQVMPGGVSSPVRSFKSVGREPVTVKSGQGAMVTDVDGNAYIDYIGSYGPLILGHANDTVLAAITKAASRGSSFGMPTEAEYQLAVKVIEAVPSIEMVRFVNSGTEATMSALRVARAATGRSKIIKCIGCYHGHHDSLLVEAGSGCATQGVPSSPGVPSDTAANTLSVPYNDAQALEAVLDANAGQIAAFILEPIAGNMGLVLPREGYLAKVRDLCTKHGVVLIFDEVMTGFRVAYGGAQAIHQIKPDLTCLGKILGGGVPCAAYGGKRELMQHVAPQGKMYQAGTLSGNPLAMAAGLATLEQLQDGKAYELLDATSHSLALGLELQAAKAGVAIQINRVGSMISCFFTSEPVHSFEDTCRCDTKRFTTFFNAMLDQGVMLPPSQFETWFVSLAHDRQAIERTIEAAGIAFQAVAESAGSEKISQS
jgi:glutamate-1-semialdehyde 2,1-aminomutase